MCYPACKKSLKPWQGFKFDSDQADMIHIRKKNIYLRYIMKSIILLFVLVSLSSCVTSGLKARAVATEECNIENYKDFINKPGVYKCNLKRAVFRDGSFSSLFGLIDAPANLSGVNLAGADLTEADLRGANLFSANLHRAILPDADLRGADLTEADLRGANLFSANLAEADLFKADLFKANLQYANLQYADLQYADLFKADLREADLQGAKVTKEQVKYLKAQGLSGFVVVE